MKGADHGYRAVPPEVRRCFDRSGTRPLSGAEDRLPMAAFTTASDVVSANFRANKPLQVVAATLVVLCGTLAIDPVDRFDWLLENLLVLVAAAAGVATYHRWPFSDLSYTLIALFVTLHLVGAHYTYAQVPAGFWLRDWLALDRNHFDRIAHFSFGLLIAYPVREILSRWSGLKGGWMPVVAFAIMIAASDLFELIEWAVALIVSPDAAAAYLGMQGDPFDAQKDIALAHAGTAIGLFAATLIDRGGKARKR